MNVPCTCQLIVMAPFDEELLGGAGGGITIYIFFHIRKNNFLIGSFQVFFFCGDAFNGVQIYQQEQFVMNS